MSTQRSAYQRTHRLAGNVLAFQLEREGEALLAAARSSAAGRSARTLTKEGKLRMTLVAVTPGAATNRHQVSGPLTIHALRGQLRIEAGDKTVTLGASHVLALGAGVEHCVQAVEESVFLVTIAMVEGGGEEGPPED